GGPFINQGGAAPGRPRSLAASAAMSNMTVSIPHRLGRAEAKRRIQDQIAQLGQRQGSLLLSSLEQRWSGDTLDFSTVVIGQRLTGQRSVKAEAGRLEVVLPWMLALLAGPVKERIEKQGRDLLGSPQKPSA